MWLLFGLLASFLWVLSDVTNSIIVHHHERNPLVIAWYQSIVEIAILILVAWNFDVASSWSVPLMLSGMSSYGAYLFLLWLFHRIDVSVINAAWAFLSILAAIGGFFFFGERWSAMQFAGMALIVSAVFLLSYWHKHVSVFRTVSYLFLLGFLYVPMLLVQKGALLAGHQIIAVFFWVLCGHAAAMFIVPFFFGRCRRDIRNGRGLRSRLFYFLNVFSVLGSVLGFFCITIAFESGYASLVGMTENAQPFFAIVVAWIATRFFPHSAPKELLTAQSIGIKIVSFLIVFAGLGMLAV